MKQAHQVNFEGFEFYIDEDARMVFFEFLENSERKFNQNPTDKQEWENFKQKLLADIKNVVKDSRKVLSLHELENIIGLQHSAAYGTNEHRNQGFGKARDFYRDMDSSVIAGVCSGLARFLSTETTWIRVLFIIIGIFSFPLGEIIYVVIWALAPSNRRNETSSAYTGNLNNHKEKYTKSNQGDNAIIMLFKGLGSLIQTIIKSAASLVGIVFIFAGIVLILSMLNIWPLHLFPDFRFHWHHDYRPRFFNEINQDKLLLLICMVLLIAIPLLSLIFNLIKSIFAIKGKNSVLKYVTLMLWFMCLLAVIGIWFSKQDNGNKTEISQTYSLRHFKSTALYIRTENTRHYVNNNEISGFLNYKVVHRNREKYILGKPDIEINRSGDFDTFEIEIIKKARHSSKNASDATLEQIAFDWHQNDSLLVIDSYFYAEDYRWWQTPEVKAIITVPKFTNVLFTEPFENH